MPHIFIGLCEIKFAILVSALILLSCAVGNHFLRIYLTKEISYGFLTEHKHGTLETFTVEILNRRTETGTKMATVAEEQTSHSLGDCVMAARELGSREAPRTR